MMKKATILVFLLTAILSNAVELRRIPVQAEEEHTTESATPGLYAFGYAAGRFPGNIDRTHSEVSDGSGVVRGSYSYIDPRYQIRTVQYTADKNGFHPILNKQPPALPRDSPVVAAAKQAHLQQFAAIADANAGHIVVPADTIAVEKAKNRHFSLYEKIAREHARIAAEHAQKTAANELDE